MLKSLLLLFIWALILSMSSPSSSSLAHRLERSVRGARNAAMESPYASPRRHRLAANPFQEIGNVLRVQGQSSSGLPSLDQERAALRDADRERQQALQETPSRRYRRVPRREEEENQAVSPTPGLRRAVPQLGLATPPDSQVPPAVTNKRALAQHARRDRENAAKTAAASAGPSTSTRAPAPAPGAVGARSLRQLARSQHKREQAAAAHVSPRTTVFDSNIHISSQDVLGSVHYYSEEERAFPDVGMYHVIVAITKMEKRINVFTKDPAEQAEYSFVGDIKTLGLISDDPSSALFCTIDLGILRPYIFVSGAVTRSDNNAGTFTLDPEQWTNTFNDHAKVQATENSAAAPKVPLKSVFPVIGFFPKTARKKPVPGEIVSSLEGETMQECFYVEVDNIAFLGTYTPLASTPSLALTTSSSGVWLFCRFEEGPLQLLQVQPEVPP
ncbi:hypothetical protein B0H13DRAFT_1934897 [Mycena leptocephala]|nr:hypothetical protein B0H13DRAFT_1934897 [Mycena leptocephala]